MDILKIFHDKLSEIGEDEMCKALELPKVIVLSYKSGKKTPSLKTCQKIIDLWGQGDNGDGSDMQVWDEAGILNGSYTPPEWGQKKKAWDGRDVCLCLAVYNDVPQAHYFSMLSVVAKYRMGLRIEFRGEDSMITRSRNHLARRFLNTGASWSIWFDSDMVFPNGNSGAYATMTNMKGVADKYFSFHTIERLISWKKTVVGGCYWDRRGSGRLIAGGNKPILNPIPSDTLAGVAFVGTGCLAIHRQVFLDISTKFPETFSEKSLGNECGFFTNIQTPERMMGEDESFAKRATDAGHPSYLDLGLCCGHIGSGNIHGIPASGSKM